MGLKVASDDRRTSKLNLDQYIIQSEEQRRKQCWGVESRASSKGETISKSLTSVKLEYQKEKRENGAKKFEKSRMKIS